MTSPLIPDAKPCLLVAFLISGEEPDLQFRALFLNARKLAPDIDLLDEIALLSQDFGPSRPRRWAQIEKQMSPLLGSPTPGRLPNRFFVIRHDHSARPPMALLQPADDFGTFRCAGLGVSVGMLTGADHVALDALAQQGAKHFAACDPLLFSQEECALFWQGGHLTVDALVRMARPRIHAHFEARELTAAVAAPRKSSFSPRV